MAIERLSAEGATVLKSPGKRSEQLVWPRNAPGSSITITRVTLAAGATSKRHAHARSEQIWIVERGAGRMLLEGDVTAEIKAGDILHHARRRDPRRRKHRARAADLSLGDDAAGGFHRLLPGRKQAVASGLTKFANRTIFISPSPSRALHEAS